jgi:LPXTG-site transpeptidase (sortase) family protein
MQRRILGSGLERLGAILFAVSIGVLTYALVQPLWAEWRYRLQQPPVEVLPDHVTGRVSPDVASSQPVAPRVAAVMPLPPMPPAAADPSSAGTFAAGFVPLEPPLPRLGPGSENVSTGGSPRPDFSPRAIPSYGRPIRVQIPRIGVDSSVAEVGIEHGEYKVPDWAVGHHMDSSYPGEPGNSVFNGHVQTLAAGRIFARLHQLEGGDTISVYTASHRLDWVVQEVRTVPQTDSSFILPTEDTRLTLYTCAGTYNPVTRHYSHWRVVVGQLVGVPASAGSATPATSDSALLPAPTGLPVSADSPPTRHPTAPARTLFEERFSNNDRDWPNDPQAIAWIADGGYHLFAQQPSQFVAIGAPLAQSFSDVIITAIFRKTGGPPGGGYGVIVRDQGPGPRDGIHQEGQYAVLEVGDRGEFGIWRREEERWIALIPWTPSEAVRPGRAVNELQVRAAGRQLTFQVNGQPVASVVDTGLSDGAVGVFVGGDLNEVLLEKFVVELPN